MHPEGHKAENVAKTSVPSRFVRFATLTLIDSDNTFQVTGLTC